MKAVHTICTLAIVSTISLLSMETPQLKESFADIIWQYRFKIKSCASEKQYKTSTDRHNKTENQLKTFNELKTLKSIIPVLSLSKNQISKKFNALKK